MSIIAFANRDRKETGQSLTAAVIAASIAIEHNYKVLLISTDFNDKTLENSFWANKQNGFLNSFMRSNSQDISNGLEGLVRTFASNRASADMIRSYTKPVLRDRLDVLPGPQTIDYKEYCLISTYFSQIADIANATYDLVIVDLSSDIPIENQKKLLNISSMVIMGLNQNQTSINDFMDLKNENEFFKRNNVILSIGRYSSISKYTNKNVARYLREKDIPFIVPYNVQFADSCSDGKIIDYLLSARTIKDRENDECIFYSTIKDTIDRIDYKRQEIEYAKI